MSGRWRVGRKVGRTIYAQLGDEPSDADPMIGVMDTPELAAEAVAGHERSVWLAGAVERLRDEVREDDLPALRARLLAELVLQGPSRASS